MFLPPCGTPKASMKPNNAGPVQSHETPKHPSPLGSQQAVAEKDANSKASVKSRIESQNLPDKPVLRRQHNPNSSGRN